MSDEIDRLWALHGLDEEAAAARASLARYPGQRAELETRVAAVRGRLETAKGRLAELQRQRRDLERDAAAVTEQERRFQSQLPAIKKNEEYQALLHEIEATRRKRSDLETEVLLRMEDEEGVLSERPGLEQGLAAAERERAERLAALEGEERAERERLAALDARRSEQLAGLSPPARSRYERVHASRDGRAVVPIVKGACSGCWRTQPPQVLQEARRRDRILSCDGCGRLLVWPPEGP